MRRSPGGDAPPGSSPPRLWWRVALALLAAAHVWAQEPGTRAPMANLNQARAIAHRDRPCTWWRVLVAGGSNSLGPLHVAELYDPANGTTAPAGVA